MVGYSHCNSRARTDSNGMVSNRAMEEEEGLGKLRSQWSMVDGQ